MTATPERDGDDRVTLLAFALSTGRYAVAAERVASVLAVGDARPVETAADPWNAGSVTVSNERVRVVDLSRALAAGRPARADESKLLVFAGTDDDGVRQGWLVDDVDVTRTVRTTDLEPTRTGPLTRYVRARLELEGDEVVLLDERAINA